MERESRKTTGFSLIELLIAILIIGILMILLIPLVQGAMQKSKQKATMGDIQSLAKAIIAYITD
jgi:general secretion pathway protein G